MAFRLLKRPGWRSVVAVLLIVLPLTLGFLDYGRARVEKRPWFSIQFAGLSDGGTTMYLGWGYVLTFWHRSISVVDAAGRRAKIGYKVGPRLTFWFLLGRESSRFEQAEDIPAFQPRPRPPWRDEDNTDKEIDPAERDAP